MMSFRIYFALFLLFGLLIGCQPETFVDESYEPTAARFTDVAQDVGLEFQHDAFRWGISGDPIAMMGGGVCWLDYDNDGWQDLYVVNSYALDEAGRWQTETGELPQSTLFRNDNGRFIDMGTATNTALSLRGNGGATADLDQNGYTDLYITTSRANVLLWNNGDGTFTDAGEGSGVDAYGWQTAISIGDVNQDGWLDIFTAGYVDINNEIEGSTMGFPNTNYGIRDLLFLSNGRGKNGTVTFTEVGAEIGLETADFEYGLGSILSDIDNDGDLDLFVANDTNPNRLYANEAVENDELGYGFRFVEVAESIANLDTNSGMGVASGDYDNNGGSDLFITNMGHQYHSVYQHQQALDYENVSQRGFGVVDFGVDWTGWGTSWGDFDLDGDLDLFVSHGAIPVQDLEADRQFAHLYDNKTVQGEQGQFADVTAASGLMSGEPILGRGSAVADFDNDGDLDIVQASIGGELVLLRNDTSGNWLVVTFADPAPGTVVTAVLHDGTELRREILAGSSYLSADELRVHFGLGGVTEIAQLRITKPNGEEISRGALVANQVIHIDD